MPLRESIQTLHPLCDGAVRLQKLLPSRRALRKNTKKIIVLRPTESARLKRDSVKMERAFSKISLVNTRLGHNLIRKINIRGHINKSLMFTWLQYISIHFLL